ncbi:hypothetical protein BLNAU_17374 [Blattamonas nauphoetae]|uniref:Uncharacterized protein n=1 Tax=Blattamonas nauphoetae TaxID=2049346 RepID=A0ABQ9X7F5_9EUKA|nr:hypothetical protein BLNAU_17374 [Blattamonas nauphoetae]
MLVDRTSMIAHVGNEKAKQTNLVEVFLRQICGKYQTLRTTMLNGLLIIATESDWALSAIHGVEYIEPLERYCEQTQPCDVPIALPKLLIVIGKSSEDECVRICESSIPSFFLKWMASISNSYILTEIGYCLVLWTSTLRSSSTFLAHHKTAFLAFLDHFKSSASSPSHLTILTKLCFSPHLEVSKLALKALLKQSKSDYETLSFLRSHNVPSGSTDSSSELVPFAGRLCSTLTEHVSEMKSLFTESSPLDATISALSVTLPSESPLFTGNTVLEVLCDGLSLLWSLLFHCDSTFNDILTKCDFVPLLKSTIITCLDLLDHERSESNCPHSDRTDLLIKILNNSWNCITICVHSSHKSLNPVVESTLSDIPQMCSLLERTCSHTSPTHSSHLRMIINIGGSFHHLIPRLLEEKLVERVIDTCKPMAIPTSNADFHLRLIWAINNLVGDPQDITKDKEERKRIRMLQFDRALNPAKQYLQFILPREEFIPKAESSNYDLSTIVGLLLTKMFLLERELFEDGEIVETGREEWEVGWLVEKTKEKDLGEKLTKIRKDDKSVKKDEKAIWKKRVERRRETGHEDAMEGWLTRRTNETPSEIVQFVRHVSVETGMNVRL